MIEPLAATILCLVFIITLICGVMIGTIIGATIVIANNFTRVKKGLRPYLSKDGLSVEWR
jgi:hypothetical protein